MPRLPTQSAVLSPGANIDFHVFGAVQAPQAQAGLTTRNYHTTAHTSLTRASLSRRVRRHPAASGSTSASSPPLPPRLSPRTPASKSTLVVKPILRGFPSTLVARVQDEERRREMKRERDEREGKEREREREGEKR